MASSFIVRHVPPRSASAVNDHVFLSAPAFFYYYLGSMFLLGGRVSWRVVGLDNVCKAATVAVVVVVDYE